MKQTISKKKNGIQWSLTEHLDNLDFADDIALLSHTHQQMQDMTTGLEIAAAELGLKVSWPKTKTVQMNNNSTNSRTLDDHSLEEVNKSTYLGSVIALNGGSKQDVKARIGKARGAFNILTKIWERKDQASMFQIRTAVGIRNMEEHHYHYKQTADIHKPLPKMHPGDLPAKLNQQHHTVGTH